MASEIGADWLGLVGPMPSGPGILTLEEARAIAAGCVGKARPILLTSELRASAILRDTAFVGVDAVQVVQHIEPDEAAALASADITYVQVIHVEGPQALDLIEHYAPHCDSFLLDSGKPSRNTLGGTGNTHDWSVSAEFMRRAGKPVFLAGGLNPHNVAEAIQQVRPDGVDICSGLRRDGRLDPELLNAFMAEVKASAAKLNTASAPQTL